MNIPDREKRRARNIIWNAAREYGFEPPLKVFDPDGRADLYWNSIIGAARRCYGAETVDALFDAILSLETREECYNFFQDLCTISEMRSMEQRFEVATLLNNGMIYNEILEKTGASSATISRVNRSLLNGAGGYESILEKMKESGEE